MIKLKAFNIRRHIDEYMLFIICAQVENRGHLIYIDTKRKFPFTRLSTGNNKMTSVMS